MTDYFQIGFCNEKVLILGNGATAQTVYWLSKTAVHKRFRN